MSESVKKHQKQLKIDNQPIIRKTYLLIKYHNPSMTIATSDQNSKNV